VLKERHIEIKGSNFLLLFLFFTPTEGVRNIKDMVALFFRIVEV